MNDNPEDTELAMMEINAGRAAEFLKALGHEGRLMILCHLASGERSVTELERLLSQPQATVSRQLARLRGRVRRALMTDAEPPLRQSLRAGVRPISRHRLPVEQRSQPLPIP